MSCWPGKKIEKSTGNAFTGVVLFSAPFSSEQRYRTPLYSKWLSIVTTMQNPPEWPVFRDAAARKKGKPKKRNSHVHGAEVMPGLSERAQKQLKATA